MRELKQALSVTAVLFTILVGAYLLAPPAHASVGSAHKDKVWMALEVNGYVLQELPGENGWIVSYLARNPLGCKAERIEPDESRWNLEIIDLLKNKVVKIRLYDQKPVCILVEVRTA